MRISMMISRGLIKYLMYYIQNVETSSLLDHKELGKQYLEHSKAMKKRKKNRDTNMSYDDYTLSNMADEDKPKKINYLK